MCKCACACAHVSYVFMSVCMCVYVCASACARLCCAPPHLISQLLLLWSESLLSFLQLCLDLFVQPPLLQLPLLLLLEQRLAVIPAMKSRRVCTCVLFMCVCVCLCSVCCVLCVVCVSV